MTITTKAKPPPIPIKILRSALLIVFLSWVGHGALIYAFQEKYIYLPSAHIDGTPTDIGLRHQEVLLTAVDGVQLQAWFIPGTSASRAAIYMHGNSSNISCCPAIYKTIHRSGLSLLTYDYRGYGNSGGEPSEQGTYKDAAAAWNWLRQQGYEDIVLVGHSLGAAVATHLATQVDPAGLVLLAPFTSIAAMGSLTYPWLPVTLLARINYPNNEFLRSYQAPLLIMHSREDNRVPYSMSQELHQLAAAKCKHLISLQGGHEDAFFSGQTEFIAPFHRFLQRADPTADCD